MTEAARRPAENNTAHVWSCLDPDYVALAGFFWEKLYQERETEKLMKIVKIFVLGFKSQIEA